MKAIVCGANGAMGKLIQASLGKDRIAGLVSLDGENGVPKTFEELGVCGADAIIDFSHHSAAGDLMRYCVERKLAVVVHTDNEKGANELATLIEKKTGVRPEITIMGPVIGSHVGPGSVSCCWLSVKTRQELHAELYS